MSPGTCGRELKENPHQTSGFFTSYLFVRAYNLAAEGREGGNQEEERFCLFHIAYFDIFKPSLADGVLPL